MFVVPVTTDKIQAAKWVHDSPELVAEFLGMVSGAMFDFTFDFFTDLVGDPEVEVDIWHRGAIVKTVSHMHWLIIYPGGKLETMSDAEFIKNFRVV